MFRHIRMLRQREITSISKFFIFAQLRLDQLINYDYVTVKVTIDSTGIYHMYTVCIRMYLPDNLKSKVTIHKYSMISKSKFYLLDQLLF